MPFANYLLFKIFFYNVLQAASLTAPPPPTPVREEVRETRVAEGIYTFVTFCLNNL